MENIGGLCLLLAFCLGVYSIVASMIGAWQGKAFLLVSASRAIYVVWALVTGFTSSSLWAM